MGDIVPTVEVVKNGGIVRNGGKRFELSPTFLSQSGCMATALNFKVKIIKGYREPNSLANLRILTENKEAFDTKH